MVVACRLAEGGRGAKGRQYGRDPHDFKQHSCVRDGRLYASSQRAEIPREFYLLRGSTRTRPAEVLEKIWQKRIRQSRGLCLQEEGARRSRVADRCSR